jgi:hypothetical protein
VHPLGQTRLQLDAGYDLKLRYPGNQSSINYAPVQAHRSIQTATYLLSTSFLPHLSSPVIPRSATLPSPLRSFPLSLSPSTCLDARLAASWARPILTTSLPVLTPPNFPLTRFMCSQSGNIQDLATYSGHSPSCILEPDAEPDSSSNQEIHHPPSLPSDMGLRYMTIPATDDARYVSPVAHWLFILVLLVARALATPAHPPSSISPFPIALSCTWSLGSRCTSVREMPRPFPSLLLPGNLMLHN